MRILMFGWEYPPRISGGLGMACHGLTQALSALGHQIVLVLPDGRDIPVREGMHIVSPAPSAVAVHGEGAGDGELIDLRSVPTPLQPYLTPGDYQRFFAGASGKKGYVRMPGPYGPKLMEEVRRFGGAAGGLAVEGPCDVIYGHDWMTVPACLHARLRHGCPYVFHVHSLEYDRSGDRAYQAIVALERKGMAEADAVIAVSAYTKERIVRLYGIAPDKITVVHNAVTAREGRERRRTVKDPNDKVVLYLGRVTYQKGPEYFLAAAALLLKELPGTTFVVAGSGDLLPHMIERAAELGIGARVRFTGFLDEEEREQVLAMSDVYVMPSVSEPFGLTPLEALMYDIPVIVTRTAGVTEVLHHALKVDFWDVRGLAEKIIAVLKYPPLGGEMVERAQEELQHLTWQAAAEKVTAVLRELVGRREG
ncbi:MAG: glycosyltransferase family 4 protein [Syntrophales bacterium]|nr:glycosyltransferase family 4 protein [Syntrophales bacterium]